MRWKSRLKSRTTQVAMWLVRDFNLDFHRMVYLEYQPETIYGDHDQRRIPAKFDIVDFEWHDEKAMHPKWRKLSSPLLDTVTELIAQTE